MNCLLIPHSNAMFWYWTAIATVLAGYAGFCAYAWWVTRSNMFALSTILSIWLFIITSSIGALQSDQLIVDPRWFLYAQRAAWIPAVLTYGLLIRAGLISANGRLAHLRRLLRMERRLIDAGLETKPSGDRG